MPADVIVEHVCGWDPTSDVGDELLKRPLEFTADIPGGDRVVGIANDGE